MKATRDREGQVLEEPGAISGLTKVLFLDMDGVLTTRDSITAAQIKIRKGIVSGELPPPETWRDKEIYQIVPEMVERLNQITEATGAKIVWSSSWRLFWDFEDAKQRFPEWGIEAELIGTTPSMAGPRGNEIQAWLDNHPEVEAFIIVDDSTDMVHLRDRLVRTRFQDDIPGLVPGLQDHHVEQAIRMLKE